jgi:Protein of unknown function (DUF1214)
MTDQTAADKMMSGKAWDDFCEALKEAGKIVQRPEVPNDPFNKALGYRFLTALLRGGLESAMHYADPQFPGFFRLADETKKLLNDNPDNYYQNCVIDGRFDYRIYGTRGTVNWFSIGSKGSSTDVAVMVDTGYIDSRQMTFNPDGSFEIVASATKKPGNWLPLAPTSRSVIVRQTFGDRKTEKIADIQIECLNPERENNNPTPESVERGLIGAASFVKNISNMTIAWEELYRKHINQLPSDDQERCQRAGGDANIHYYQSYWKLADDEAMFVHLDDIPDCQTWNLQLSNYWMQSLDYRYFKVCVNKHTAHYEPDGSVKIVIAARDPGPKYPNWLNTLHHGEGGMLGRYVGAKVFPKEMKSKVVKLSELK